MSAEVEGAVREGNAARLATPADVDAIFHIRTSVQENHLSLDQLAEMGITH